LLFSLRRERLLLNGGSTAAVRPSCRGTFWIEDTPRDVMTNNHLALIHVAKRLLQSPCAAVVPAAVAFLFALAPVHHTNSTANPLVRLPYETPTTAELSLIVIQMIARQCQHTFLPHTSHFYINAPRNLNQVYLT
jgi:hypothetical protein